MLKVGDSNRSILYWRREMKRASNRIVKIASFVFLFGSATALWLLGLHDAGRHEAAAFPLGYNCPEGQFCGRTIDNTGGCTNVPCCPQGTTICASVDTHAHVPFPRVASSNPGTCMQATLPVEYCRVNACGVATLCSEGTCVATVAKESDMRVSWVSTGTPCPGATE